MHVVILRYFNNQVDKSYIRQPDISCIMRTPYMSNSLYMANPFAPLPFYFCSITFPYIPQILILQSYYVLFYVRNWYSTRGGTRWHSRLRYCAISRVDAGSILDGVIWIFQYGSGVESTRNSNEYQEYFLGEKDGRCVGLTTTDLLPSFFECLEILEPQPPGALRACPDL
jgi:hypothetical protein